MIQQYAPLERAPLEQAHHKGNIMIGPAPNAQGEYRLAISHYLQQGDNMTLVIDKAQKRPTNLSIATYLDDPSDAVKVDVAFSRTPGGPNPAKPSTASASN